MRARARTGEIKPRKSYVLERVMLNVSCARAYARTGEIKLRVTYIYELRLRWGSMIIMGYL